MGVDGTPNFWIQVLSSYTLGNFTSTDVVKGNLANFGDQLVVAQTPDTDNTNTMPTGANVPAANTTVTLAKSMFNVMDTGSVTLTFTLGVLTELDSHARLYVDVPKSYRPDLGSNIRCLFNDAEGVLVEEVFCEMRWDWSLMVWGPRAATMASPADAPVAFDLVLQGVQFSTSNTNNW